MTTYTIPVPKDLDSPAEAMRWMPLGAKKYLRADVDPLDIPSTILTYLIGKGLVQKSGRRGEMGRLVWTEKGRCCIRQLERRWKGMN